MFVYNAGRFSSGAWLLAQAHHGTANFYSSPSYSWLLLFLRTHSWFTGWFLLKSALMGGLQDSIWVVLGQSLVAEKSLVVAWRFEPSTWWMQGQHANHSATAIYLNPPHFIAAFQFSFISYWQISYSVAKLTSLLLHCLYLLLCCSHLLLSIILKWMLLHFKVC